MTCTTVRRIGITCKHLEAMYIVLPAKYNKITLGIEELLRGTYSRKARLEVVFDSIWIERTTFQVSHQA